MLGFRPYAGAVSPGLLLVQDAWPRDWSSCHLNHLTRSAGATTDCQELPDELIQVWEEMQ